MLSTCIAQEYDSEFRKRYDNTQSNTSESDSLRLKKSFKESEIINVIEENNQEWKHNYISLGFLNSKMDQYENHDLKSNYGVSFNIGRTFYLHKPIGKFLRFGIDVTWCDMTYTNYKIKHITYWGTDKYQYHQGELSMQIGPSFTIRPIEKFNIHGYFRYAPSFSALYADDTFYGNYATYFVGGASISYGAIGLGIEARFGNCKYKEFDSDSEEQILFMNKTKHNGWKAYLTFRF